MKLICLDHLEFNKPYLLVFLDSLQTKKALYYHDILLWWQDFFEKIKITVYIVTPDAIEEHETIKYMYHSKYQYISCNDKNVLKQFEVYSTKNVFGKEYEIIHASMFLINEAKIVKKSKRINQKALKNMYFSLIKLQYEIFLKKIEKIVDTSEKL